MSVTAQERVAQSARRAISRFSAAAGELGVYDEIRFRVRMNLVGNLSGWYRDDIDARTAISTVNVETETALDEGHLIEFTISATFPALRVNAQGDTFPTRQPSGRST